MGVARSVAPISVGGFPPCHPRTWRDPVSK